MTTAPYADDPIFEDELVAGSMVVRSTVDHTGDGEVYSILTLEPDDGPLSQTVAPMSEADWGVLEAICRGARDAIQRWREGRAA